VAKVNIIGDIVSAKNFENENIYIKWKFNIPEEW